MNLETIILSEINQSEKVNTKKKLYKVLGILKIIETESRMVIIKN